MSQRRNLGFLLTGPAGLLACIIGASRPAFANILSPGTTGPPDALSFRDGAVVASTSGTFTSVLGASDFSRTFIEDVRSDPDNTFGNGDLTWYIKVTNNSASGTALETVSTSSFEGWMTDVGYVTCSLASRLRPYLAGRRGRPSTSFSLPQTA